MRKEGPHFVLADFAFVETTGPGVFATGSALQMHNKWLNMTAAPGSEPSAELTFSEKHQ
jgi:hypothetical protein